MVEIWKNLVEIWKLPDRILGAIDSSLQYGSKMISDSNLQFDSNRDNGTMMKNPEAIRCSF